MSDLFEQAAGNLALRLKTGLIGPTPVTHVALRYEEAMALFQALPQEVKEKAEAFAEAALLPPTVEEIPPVPDPERTPPQPVRPLPSSLAELQGRVENGEEPL